MCKPSFKECPGIEPLFVLEDICSSIKAEKNYYVEKSNFIQI